jgi:predicted dehydrogenase
MNSVYGVWQYNIEKEATPQNIDWPAFLGSAPKRPFSAERFFRWRKYWDYGNGVISDFYYHRLAPLMVSLGGRFPVLVGAHGGIYQFKDREVPDTISMVVEYDGFHVNIASSAAGSGPEKYHAPAIYGHEGTIGFGNGSITVTPEKQFRKKFQEKTGKPELVIEAEQKNDNVIRINHARNFFDCMHTRKQPVLHAELGYQVMVGIRLAADSYRQRRMLAFDPKSERPLREAPPRPEFQGTGENYKEPA